MGESCTLPPSGWYCTRTGGHNGPCAAHPTEPSVGDEIRDGDILIRRIDDDRFRLWYLGMPGDLGFGITTTAENLSGCIHGFNIVLWHRVVDARDARRKAERAQRKAERARRKPPTQPTVIR